MLKRILVPLDGSERAEKALSTAAKIARSNAGSLVLLRVVTINSEVMFGMEGQAPVFQSAIEADLAVAAEYLEKLTALPLFKGIPTETVAMFGSTARTIIDIVGERGIDLIVLCSHGYTGLAHVVMGSVADSISHQVAVPVLVMREKGPDPCEAEEGSECPLHVLVPLDGTVLAKAALQPAAALAGALARPGQSIIHLTRVVKTHGLTVDKQEKERAEHYMQETTELIREGQIAPNIHRQQITITSSVVDEPDIAKAIVKLGEQGGEAGNRACNIIAITTHGRTGFNRWVMGSMAEKILETTNLPVLIVRRPEAAHAEQPIYSQPGVTIF